MRSPSTRSTVPTCTPSAPTTSMCSRMDFLSATLLSSVAEEKRAARRLDASRGRSKRRPRRPPALPLGEDQPQQPFLDAFEAADRGIARDRSGEGIGDELVAVHISTCEADD